VERRGTGEGLTVECAGVFVAPQLPPVRGEGAGGEGAEKGVTRRAKRVEEGRGGRVPALGAEHDRGEQALRRGLGAAEDGRVGQRVTPEGGGSQGGFVHPSFLALPPTET
jgi:hypothetical protein